jgi:hypothetical protein
LYFRFGIVDITRWERGEGRRVEGRSRSRLREKGGAWEKGREVGSER